MRDAEILIPILVPLGAFAMVFGIIYLRTRENMAMITKPFIFPLSQSVVVLAWWDRMQWKRKSTTIPVSTRTAASLVAAGKENIHTFNKRAQNQNQCRVASGNPFFIFQGRKIACEVLNASVLYGMKIAGKTGYGTDSI
ncbi:MAG: hypothetical protein EOO14_17580 [Chitinophagaceae bacterium]|nr:MAG: hypothetical protein EOO14_17580 [Chitinophagaceae bacterium]